MTGSYGGTGWYRSRTWRPETDEMHRDLLEMVPSSVSTIYARTLCMVVGGHSLETRVDRPSPILIDRKHKG